MPRGRSPSPRRRDDRSRSPPRRERSKSPEDTTFESNAGQPCEALLMGKWLPGRIQRIGRDGEVDLVLDDGTELESVPEERLRMPKSAPGLKRASSWECLECLAKDHHVRQGKAGRAPLLKTSMKKDEVRGVEALPGKSW